MISTIIQHRNPTFFLHYKFLKWLHISLSFCLIFLLSACGGDHKNHKNTEPSPINQAFAFKRAGTIQATLGDSITNTASGKGSGTITYKSSNTTVATVNNTGDVKTLSIGTAIITANIAADSTYLAATSNYTLNVVGIAPSSLANIRLTLNVTKATSPDWPMFPGTGIINANYNDKEFAEDGTDVNLGNYASDYTLTSHGNNQLIISATTDYGQSKTTLTFSNNDTGTFVRDYFDDTGEQLFFTHEGNFSLTHEAFKVMPQNFTNLEFTLNFSKVEAKQPTTELPVPNENFRMMLLKNNRTEITPKNVDINWGANYAITPVDVHSATIKGIFDDSGHAYKLDLKFHATTRGTFTLDIDNGNTIASGDFSTIKKIPIEHTALKGQLITGNRITSALTQTTYPYTVYLPQGYSTSNQTYPIVYVMDGQWYSDFAYIIDQKNKDVIMVAIGQGPEDRRVMDYTPMGADTYIQFLQQEFIPMIESEYHTNKERTFFGASLSGLLGEILLSKEPVGTPYFKNYILADGTMSWYTPNYFQAEIDRYNSSNTLAINLLLSTTRQGNLTAVNGFAKRYADRNYKDFNIITKEYKLTHDEMGPVTFNEYIDVLY